MIMRMMNSMAVDRQRVMASVWARVVSKSVTGRRKRARLISFRLISHPCVPALGSQSMLKSALLCVPRLGCEVCSRTL